MASTAETGSPRAAYRRDLEVPLWRLYLMRAVAIPFIVSGFSS